MKIIYNDEIPLKSWNSLLKSSNFASPFQTPEFYQLFNSLEGLSAEAIAITNSENLLALVVIILFRDAGIKGFFSRRAIIYGGPLILPNELQAIDLLLKEIPKIFSNKAIYVETRNFFDYSRYKPSFLKNKWDYIPHLNFHLNTGNSEDMCRNVSKSRMRQIKKALKSGVFWKEAISIEEVDTFYDILSALYKKIKKPLLPKSFFRVFFESNCGKYLLVYYEGEIIGGIMCPVFPNKAIYEFYICGLDHEFKNQYPSIIATWAAMEFAIQHALPLFDFMGAGAPDRPYGVREFKARFGAELVEHGRFTRILNPPLYKIGVLGLKLINILRF